LGPHEAEVTGSNPLPPFFLPLVGHVIKKKKNQRLGSTTLQQCPRNQISVKQKIGIDTIYKYCMYFRM